jgi:uncharacterized protein (DUF2336 family)
MALTYEDIHLLVREPSSKVRADIAQKVAASYNSTKFTPKANKIAVDILRLLLKDTSRLVRGVLAQELKHNDSAPHDVILSLSHDDFDIAEDILLHSNVLQESDILELVRANDEVKKLIAISKRKHVSERTSTALVATGKTQVVTSLLENTGANISESCYSFIMTEFRHDQSILEALVYRGGLSYTLAEKLYSLVSGGLKKQMTKRYLMPRLIAEKTTNDVREAAILRFLSPWMTDEDTIGLVEQMYQRKRLTNSIIIRALCLGEIAFFEASMAKRVGVPLVNARKLLKDPGESGFSALYRASKLPQEYREAVRIMLKLVREEVKQNSHRSSDYSQRLAQQIRVNHYDSSVIGMENFVSFLEQPQAALAFAE